MIRVTTTLGCILAFVAIAAPEAAAQRPRVRLSIGAGFGGWQPGYGAYGPGYGGWPGAFGGYGYDAGYFGYGGYGAYSGYGVGYGGAYGPFNYSQPLYQQQAALSQQIVEQQQQAIVDQVRQAQGRLEQADAARRQMFERYLDLDDVDQAAVRARLMNNYLNLDPLEREGWRRDAVVQIVIGRDLERLDAVAEFRDLSESDRIRFRQRMMQKYHSLTPERQQDWRSDPIVELLLGRNWWSP